MQKKANVLIFGATGWFGKITISYFLNLYPNFNLVLVSKKSETFMIRGKIFKTISFTDFKNLHKQKIDYFFDFAFLTGNLITELDKDLYVKKTNQLIDSVTNFFQNNEIKKTLLTSSGAVYWKNSPKENIYTLQKIKQEELIIKTCKDLNITYHVARVFAVLANPIYARYEYAFTSFVKQAKFDKTINIFSKSLVNRSYLYFDYLLDYFLLNQENKIYDSWNVNLEIYELAKIVADFYNVEIHIPNDRRKFEEDNYMSNDLEFYKNFKSSFEVKILIEKLLSEIN